ncbi:MAG: calcium-binding protein, partial [Deltaproteobacteria bacterium]|nr:calcium-binding protein [Deltaproteobacteria bacterium]
SVVFTSLNWNAPRTVTATGVDDLVADGNQPYTIVTAPAVSDDEDYDELDPTDVSASNTDNDSPGITVSPTAGLITTEAGGVALFSVRLNSEPTASVTIPLSSSDEGEGTVSPASLTFTTLNWNAPQFVTVTGVDDPEPDGDQPYTVNTEPATSTDSGYNHLDGPDAAVTNIDDDTPGIRVNPITGLVTTEAGGTATFTVVLLTQPTADVVIGLSSSDEGEGTVSSASLTFTTENWAAPQTVTVTGVDDDVADGNQPYTLVTAPAVSADSGYNGLDADNVSATNTDDDSPGITVAPTSGLTTTEGGPVGVPTIFTVVLNSEPTADVSIGVSSSDPTEGTAAPTSLVFTSLNWNAPQVVTVTGVDDFVADGDQPYTILTAAAVSGDSGYHGIDPEDVAVTNIDNDSPGFTVAPTEGLETSEGPTGTPTTFTIRLNSQPTADVRIALSSSDTTEGTVAPSVVTFTSVNWAVAQTVTVTGVDDLVADGDVPYTIVTAEAESLDPNYDGRDPANVSVTNIDNDTAGIRVVPNTGLTTSEDGGIALFTIVLNSQPTASVTIGLSSSDLTEGTVAPSSVTFTVVNWSVPQVITVTGVDDLIPDGNQPYLAVTAPAVSLDPAYDELDAVDARVVNIDNE